MVYTHNLNTLSTGYLCPTRHSGPVAKGFIVIKGFVLCCHPRLVPSLVVVQCTITVVLLSCPGLCCLLSSKASSSAQISLPSFLCLSKALGPKRFVIHTDFIVVKGSFLLCCPRFCGQGFFLCCHPRLLGSVICYCPRRRPSQSFVRCFV
jgi:hypothetical protein